MSRMEEELINHMYYYAIGVRTVNRNQILLIYVHCKQSTARFSLIPKSNAANLYLPLFIFLFQFLQAKRRSFRNL